MFSFNKFIVTASIATITSLTVGWASASLRDPNPPSIPVLTDLELDAAYTEAQGTILAAPEFCAVTYIMRDETRGYVAVCELDTAE